MGWLYTGSPTPVLLLQATFKSLGVMTLAVVHAQLWKVILRATLIPMPTHSHVRHLDALSN